MRNRVFTEEGDLFDCVEDDGCFVLRLAQVGTSVDSKARRRKDEVVSKVSDTKGYAA